jgi:hypothetical protein
MTTFRSRHRVLTLGLPTGAFGVPYRSAITSEVSRCEDAFVRFVRYAREAEPSAALRIPAELRLRPPRISF